MGFKLIALPVEYKVIESWTPICEDPNYWTHERLAKEYSKFKNVATIFGKTHIKDKHGFGPYLNCLDSDCEFVYNNPITPIEQLSLPGNPVPRSNIQNLLFKAGASSLLKYLKLVTCVVKTRKSYGVDVYWSSYRQNNHIKIEGCKSQPHESCHGKWEGLSFEIICNCKCGHRKNGQALELVGGPEPNSIHNVQSNSKEPVQRK